MTAYTFNLEEYDEIRHEDGGITPVPKKKEWPAIGKTYWKLYSDFTNEPRENFGLDSNHTDIKNHNTFKTVESVEFAASYLKLHIVLVAAHELVEPGYKFVPDKRNWVIINFGGEVDVGEWEHLDCLTPSYSSREKAEEALALLKDWGVFE